MKCKTDAWGCLLPEARLSLIRPMLRSKLVCRRWTKGQCDTNLIRALRPIEPLMIHQAAVRARATRRCFFRGGYVDITPGRKWTSQEWKRRRYLWEWDDSLPGVARMTCSPSWTALKETDGLQSMHGSVPAREKASFGVHVQCISFLFRKLLGRCPRGLSRIRDPAVCELCNGPVRRCGTLPNFQLFDSPARHRRGSSSRNVATLISSETSACEV
jgi:hypothetical protein